MVLSGHMHEWSISRSLDQILNDYHITYDRSRFVVEYTPNGSNLLPYISVILLSDTAGHGKGAAK